MKLIIAALLLLATPALAQPEQQPYVPFSIEQADFDQLLRYLEQQPMGVVEPIVQFLRHKEAEAQRTKAKPGEHDAGPRPAPDQKH